MQVAILATRSYSPTTQQMTIGLSLGLWNGDVQAREYMVALEGHLGEVHKQAQKLLKRQAELGQAMAEFGAAMAALGQLEQGRLASAFSGLGDKAAAVASTSQVGRAQLLGLAVVSLQLQ